VGETYVAILDHNRTHHGVGIRHPFRLRVVPHHPASPLSSQSRLRRQLLNIHLSGGSPARARTVRASLIACCMYTRSSSVGVPSGMPKSAAPAPRVGYAKGLQSSRVFESKHAHGKQHRCMQSIVTRTHRLHAHHRCAPQPSHARTPAGAQGRHGRRQARQGAAHGRELRRTTSPRPLKLAQSARRHLSTLGNLRSHKAGSHMQESQGW
jgi:hypothetical protein